MKAGPVARCDACGAREDRPNGGESFEQPPGWSMFSTTLRETVRNFLLCAGCTDRVKATLLSLAQDSLVTLNRTEADLDGTD